MKSKKNISELAIFTGVPAFNEVLHVGRPNIGSKDRLLERINNILDNKWLSNNGPYVQEFERQIEKRLGVKHCIAMCNGTVALEIAIRAIGMKGEVILPSFTFVATAHALQWQEITPIFCDIDPITHHIDPLKIEKMITPKTSGIIGVHLWGQPCNVNALQEIATSKKLGLMFDAAHSFGCSYNGQMVGNFGDLEVFSFHATKFFNTFEGGAITTNNDEIAAKIRLMKNFGFSGYDNVIYIGTNGKMTEVCAAMGLTGLESIDEFISVNKNNYSLYREFLRGVAGVRMHEYSESNISNYQYIVLEIDEKLAGISRNNLMSLLHKENVLARRYFYPGCHRMEPYRSNFPHAGLLLPETEDISDKILVLPTGTAVDKEAIKIICDVIRLAIAGAFEIKDSKEYTS